MKPSYKTIIATALTMIGSLITTPSANAGFVEWVNHDTENQETSIKDSFDYAFAIFKKPADAGSTPALTADNTAPKETKAIKTYKISMSAYNSEPGQTDDSPCITANGYNVCTANIENVIATNFLPFNTAVKIPEITGDRILYVKDRMNKRYTPSEANGYSYYADLWMRNKQDALKLGRRSVTMIVVDASQIEK